MPQAAAMYAGGWKDAATFMYYQKVREADLFLVAEGRKSVPSVAGR